MEDSQGDVYGLGYYNENIATTKSKISSITNSNKFTLGKHGNTSITDASPLNCKIYAVRIYNRALTDEEIKYNYLLDKARYGI